MRKSSKISFDEYINNLPKSELCTILKTFNISYKSTYKKDKLSSLVTENLDKIVRHSYELFQSDELANIKVLIKNNGYSRPRTNYLLLYFLQNLSRLGLVIKINESEFIMTKEVLTKFKNLVKNKNLLVKVKQNTNEYNLILGILSCYGVLTYDKFYEVYSKYFKYTSEELFNKLNTLKLFYEEFNVIDTKSVKYICNKRLITEKECKKYINKNAEYKEFSIEDYVNINKYNYMKKFEPFNKMIKFVKRNYYMDEKDIKVFNKYIIVPYLEEIQVKNSEAENILSTNIDKYFEYKNEKHKAKFMNLIKDITNDYPLWSLNGYSKREKECQK